MRLIFIRKPTIALTIAVHPRRGRGPAAHGAARPDSKRWISKSRIARVSRGLARELERAVRVDDRIVPRRHRGGGLRVPRRRNVSVRPVEDRDRFGAGRRARRADSRARNGRAACRAARSRRPRGAARARRCGSPAAGVTQRRERMIVQRAARSRRDCRRRNDRERRGSRREHRAQCRTGPCGAGCCAAAPRSVAKSARASSATNV